MERTHLRAAMTDFNFFNPYELITALGTILFLKDNIFGRGGGGSRKIGNLRKNMAKNVFFALRDNNS